MIKKILIASCFLILILNGCSNNKEISNIETKPASPDLQIKSDDKLDLDYISSKECKAKGGIVTQVSLEAKKCPKEEIFLGMVSDVNCICACCK